MKYQLTRAERGRFGELAAKEVLATITKRERKELLALDRKRSKLWERSPAGKQARQVHRRSMRKIDRMMRQLDRLLSHATT